MMPTQKMVGEKTKMAWILIHISASLNQPASKAACPLHWLCCRNVILYSSMEFELGVLSLTPESIFTDNEGIFKSFAYDYLT